MKKAILLLAAALLLTCTACGESSSSIQYGTASSSSAGTDEGSQAESIPSSEPDGSSSSATTPEESAGDTSAASAESSDGEPDIDLTTLSSIMVYSEVFNMSVSPEEYIGKTIRMAGIFTTNQNPETEQISCAVLVQDATACCAQGFEIIMPEDAVYPQDYPDFGSEVTVVGELQADRSLEEYGMIFLRLENVTFEPPSDL